MAQVKQEGLVVGELVVYLVGHVVLDYITLARSGIPAADIVLVASRNDCRINSVSILVTHIVYISSVAKSSPEWRLDALG